MRIGILGSGQLAQMIKEAGETKLHLSIDLLTDFKSQERLKNFIHEHDTLLFENEFIDTELLKKTAIQAKAQFYPSLFVIHTLQNKLRQKDLLKKCGVPYSDFEILTPSLSFSQDRILKWAELGYDGNGTCVSKDPAQRKDFLDYAFQNKKTVFAEDRVDFIRELSLVCCRSTKLNSMVFYPLVISQQDHGICKQVHGPAINFGVNPQYQTQAETWAQSIAHELNIVGTFAIEFFETRDGKLLVNELAPRVHNTGHWSIDFCKTSQFENHLRGCLNLKLGSTAPLLKKSKNAFMMWNILGPAKIHKTLKDGEIPRFPPLPVDAKLKWYGKLEIRPRRKLGHINLEFDPTSLETVQKMLSTWDQSMF